MLVVKYQDEFGSDCQKTFLKDVELKFAMIGDIVVAYILDAETGEQLDSFCPEA